MKHQLLMMNLLTAVYWFDEALQSSLNRNGYESVTRAQSLLIANIAAGEHRAIRLARNLGISRQSVSQMIAELEARDLVVSEADPDDRRARIVKFSPGSATLRDASRFTLLSLQEELKKRIGARAYQALSKSLLAEWGEPPIIEMQHERDDEGSHQNPPGHA